MTTRIPFKWTVSEQAWGLDANDFAIANGLNALVTQQIDGVEDELYSQIKGWFGLPQTGTSWPVCAGLTNWTAPTNASYPGRGGQSYPMTPRGSVLIDPPPADWFRE